MQRSRKRLAIGTSIAAVIAVLGYNALRDSPVPYQGPTDVTTTAVGAISSVNAATDSFRPADSTTITMEGAAPTSTTATTMAGAPGASTSTTAAPASTTCAKPAYKTSDADGMWNTQGYFVHNNMWNEGEAGPQTLYACGYDNWYVTSTQPNSTSVKTYPNAHKDFGDVRISSFKSIRSTFAATTPHTGIYNVAFDIWINGIAEKGSTELMIWTENVNQRPSGDIVTSVTLGGRTYDVWKSGTYIAFVPKQAVTSGSIDLLEIFNWTMSKGYMPSGSTLGQIDYGVEICSTNNKPATFTFTNFSIATT